MGRQLSMTTRKELIEGIDKRYRASNRKEEQQILEQFTRVYPPKARHSLAQLRDGYGAK